MPKVKRVLPAVPAVALHARSVALIGEMSRLLDNLPEVLTGEREQMEAELLALIDIEAAYFVLLPVEALGTFTEQEAEIEELHLQLYAANQALEEYQAGMSLN